jgi:hypothetical protein
LADHPARHGRRFADAGVPSPGIKVGINAGGAGGGAGGDKKEKGGCC